jgi:hypothetical protein
MKKILAPATVFLLFCCIFQACKKDGYQSSFNYAYTYNYYVPIYSTKAEVRANIKSIAPIPVQNPGKLYLRGSYLFMTEADRGIHVFDNSDPAHPRNISFINIPGNMDLAVKGNTLYADLYKDLVAVDITNPLQVSLKKVVEDVFPERNYGSGFSADSTRIIIGWEMRDTTIRGQSQADIFMKTPGIFILYSAADNMGSGPSSVSPYGVGGSTARFTLAKDRLYTVSHSLLNVLNVANEQDPVFVNQKQIGWNIETIYPFRDRLFIGSTTGMFMFDISSPDDPIQAGQFSHVQSCDPVIADDQYAYVTLRSGTSCAGNTNTLEVLKLNDPGQPTLMKTYNLFNPHGLSKDGNLLFVCDGRDGLKVYDASNIQQLQLLQQIKGMEALDVIAMDGLALVMAKEGLYQYNYSDPAHLRLLSRILTTP